MRDVTDNVEVKTVARVMGKSVADELWHAGKKIGTRTAGGPKFDDPNYEAKVVPDGQMRTLKVRIFRK